MKYFIANWKANKNLKETEEWLTEFLKIYQDKDGITVIICPPFPFLTKIKQRLDGYKNLKTGVQDLSKFEQGAYTGEVTAKTLAGLADFAIIGHSERRKNFQESDESIHQKLIWANKYQIKPVVCIRDKNDWTFADQAPVVAYEPVYAIGTGNNEPVQKVIELKNSLNLSPKTAFLYGGSVNEKNAQEYLAGGEIQGFLVGGASLNPKSFYQIFSFLT